MDLSLFLQGNLGELIGESFRQTVAAFLDSERDTYRDDGSTASTAVLVAIPLSEDHKPNRSDERKRIESAGGIVMWAGTWRVGGVLAMSRNHMLKQFDVAELEIQGQVIDEEFELLVLASDGLGDVVPNETGVFVIATCNDLLFYWKEPEAAARKLTGTSFARGSADNITSIVVRFHHDKAESAGAHHD
ncbi:hypothetical protein M0R45_038091 [Rubus argutus]|uniref:PPM-type phosphatase domain-containing protein n=1 Tax=Rubus argutus TaxID=59490 RepID=A0AAW1W6A0_RUBAR